MDAAQPKSQAAARDIARRLRRVCDRAGALAVMHGWLAAVQHNAGNPLEAAIAGDMLHQALHRWQQLMNASVTAAIQHGGHRAPALIRGLESLADECARAQQSSYREAQILGWKSLAQLVKHTAHSSRN